MRSAPAQSCREVARAQPPRPAPPSPQRVRSSRRARCRGQSRALAGRRPCRRSARPHPRGRRASGWVHECRPPDAPVRREWAALQTVERSSWAGPPATATCLPRPPPAWVTAAAHSGRARSRVSCTHGEPRRDGPGAPGGHPWRTHPTMRLRGSGATMVEAPREIGVTSRVPTALVSATYLHQSPGNRCGSVPGHQDSRPPVEKNN